MRETAKIVDAKPAVWSKLVPASTAYTPLVNRGGVRGFLERERR
jgi:hypothetical protein